MLTEGDSTSGVALSNRPGSFVHYFSSALLA